MLSCHVERGRAVLVKNVDVDSPVQVVADRGDVSPCAGLEEVDLLLIEVGNRVERQLAARLALIDGDVKFVVEDVLDVVVVEAPEAARHVLLLRLGLPHLYIHSGYS